MSRCCPGTLLKARHGRAIGDARVGPGTDEDFHAVIGVSDWGTRDVGTWRGSDRFLTVFVDDDLEAPDEVLAVVQVKRATELSFMVQELEFIFRTLDLVGPQPAPSFANLQDRQRRDPPVRKEAAERERKGPTRRLLEDQRSGWFEIEHDAEAFEQLGDARQIDLDLGDRQLHPGQPG